MIKTAMLVLAAVVVVGALWYFAGPLVTNTEVNEPLPTPAELAEMSPDKLEAVREKVMQKAAEMPGQNVIEEMPLELGIEPAVLKAGSFEDADGFHKGSGTTTLYEFPDGSRIVRLENFSVTNGPDLHVLLSESENPAGRETLGGYIDLGSLKGNRGGQNYAVSETADISRYKSVVIYCKPFHVVFTVASFE